MARPRARRSLCRSPLFLSKKWARLSSFNWWQRHLQYAFPVFWAPIHRAVETTQRVLTNKQWLLYSHCQYFSCSPACATASAPLLAREPFNQLLKAQFWLTQSFKSNFSNARTILTLLKLVILTERLPTWFHERTSAPNGLNAQQGLIFLKEPSALNHGLK